MPEHAPGHTNLWSPGVKYGVQPGGYTHMTEFFGPVLGVMRFQTLREAVNLVNQTGFGLTSGLESLDDREWEYWTEHIRAGNLYINRVTTGAVVLRQPFGGIGKSGFGPGMKAGGPNYVAQLMDFTDAVEEPPKDTPELPALRELAVGLASKGEAAGIEKREIDRIIAAAVSYERNWESEFSQRHDHFKLIGQDNFRLYRKRHYVRVRIHPDDSAFDLFARVCAARTSGSRITVSYPPDFKSKPLELLEQLTEAWAGDIEFVEETDEHLAQAVRQQQADRVRYAAPERAPDDVLEASALSGLCVVSNPVSMEGRLEMLWYVYEQSLSIDYHRYGNLGGRADESRAEPE